MGTSVPEYRAFTGRLPDPRECDLAGRTESVAAVVAVEGPVVVARAYRCVVRAAGGKQVTALVRAMLDEAVEELVTGGRLVLHGEDGEEGLPGGVLRSPDVSEVVPRRRGVRDLDEIPVDEVAAIVADIWTRAPRMQGENLKRTVLDRLELVRLTPAVARRLDRAIAHATARRTP